MNNEIIIDGVNVAECERYCKFDNRNEPNKCYSYIYEGYSDCKPKENQCFFYVKKIEKQLQQLKAENEKLKKQHYETLKMLKHEYNGRQRDNEQWFTRCTENHNEDSKIIEKYKQALEEIREIANTGQNGNCSKCSKKECEDNNCIETAIFDILTKINEVLKDE